jgi:hypothetical protein
MAEKLRWGEHQILDYHQVQKEIELSKDHSTFASHGAHLRRGAQVDTVNKIVPSPARSSALMQRIEGPQKQSDWPPRHLVVRRAMRGGRRTTC